MAETSNAGFIDWEQVSPESSSSASSINGREGQVAASTTPLPPPPPVFIDDFANIFPPSCHEGLLVQIEPDPSSPPPSRPFWADVLQPHPSSDSRVQVRANFVRRLKSGIGVLYTNLLIFRKNMFPCCFSRKAVLSYSAGVAMGLFGVLLYLRRRRRPIGNDSLLLLIREKDEKISQLLRQVAQMNEKISQLLHHIAQMNETLSAQQRIPVIRSS
ncbi:hypothetical protein H6P81_020164 [Aristolochia fimbriata]|uniref:Uncharacterized protein n=1 Tax=Aristolochia fimbriata TaxID=158543 RepID=A0AAV7DU02_ARIFI|nr:hypothetical protein H6P81_020164 [Aristolochia fimbriata]